MKEIEILERSAADLQTARLKFEECSETIKSFDKISNGDEIMVPLTPSLYVPGNLINTDEFLIDIGTGYYIERDRKASEDYFKRKSQFVNIQMEKIVKSLREKNVIRQSCVQCMQKKIADANKKNAFSSNK